MPLCNASLQRACTKCSAVLLSASTFQTNIINVYFKKINVDVLKRVVLWSLTFRKSLGGSRLLFFIAFYVIFEI